MASKTEWKMEEQEDGLHRWTKSTKPQDLTGSGVLPILVRPHQVNDQVNESPNHR